MTSRTSRIMHRSAGLGALCAVLAAGTLVLTGSARSAGSQRTIRVFEHDTSQQTIDVGVTGTSPGDQFVFAGDVFDRKGGKKLGRAAGSCLTVSGSATVPGEVFCTATIKLRGGQITSQGLFKSSELFGGKTLGFPITGGNGKYRNAHGDGTVRVPTNVPNQTDAYFVLRLG